MLSIIPSAPIESKIVLKIYFILFVMLISSMCCYGQDNGDVYRIDWSHDKYTLTSSSAILLGSYFIDRGIGTITEEQVAALDRNDIFAWDRFATNHFSTSAATLSDYFRDGIILVPFTLLLSKQGRKEWDHLGFMYIETFMLTSGITTATKGVFRRVRPYAYNPDVSLDFILQKNTRKSFYSGHTSHVASLSFLTASIYEDLYPDSRWRHWVWVGAIAAPTITGIARIKGGKHFLTDVVVGYGVGAAVGYFIPKLHKVQKDSELTIVPVGLGASLNYQF